jgi:hypothetical protein
MDDDPGREFAESSQQRPNATSVRREVCLSLTVRVSRICQEGNTELG